MLELIFLILGSVALGIHFGSWSICFATFFLGSVFVFKLADLAKAIEKNK